MPEPENAQFEDWFDGNAPITVSALAMVELVSALHKMERASRLGRGGVSDILRLVDRDLHEGFVLVQSWPGQAFDLARTLVALHSGLRLRSLDALQLACAQISGGRQFVTADRKLALAARASDLDVLWFGPGEL